MAKIHKEILDKEITSCYAESVRTDAKDVFLRQKAETEYPGRISCPPLCPCLFGHGFFHWEGFMNRIAQIGIIVEDKDSVPKMNEILHDFGPYILGRMGIPHREYGISILSLVVDAPQNVTAALSGKLGMLSGVTTKTIYAKMEGIQK